MVGDEGKESRSESTLLSHHSHSLSQHWLSQSLCLTFSYSLLLYKICPQRSESQDVSEKNLISERIWWPFTACVMKNWTALSSCLLALGHTRVVHLPQFHTLPLHSYCSSLLNIFLLDNQRIKSLINRSLTWKEGRWVRPNNCHDLSFFCILKHFIST